MPANEVWGKVIFSQACVIPSVHWGKGGWLSRMHPPEGICIRGGLPPGEVCRFRGGVGVGLHRGRGVPASRRGEGSAASRTAGQTPSPPIHGIRSTSGRYASYWNAFFFNCICALYMRQSKAYVSNISTKRCSTK